MSPSIERSQRELEDDEAIQRAINEFTQPVFIKNESEVVIATNEGFERFFSGNHVTGRHAKAFLDASFQRVSACSDEIILSGTDRLDCVHTGAAVDGYFYVVQIHKRSLTHLKRAGYAILGIVQPEERLDTVSRHVELTRLAAVFRDFDDRDQEICRLVALGKNSVEIGESLKTTSRTIEIRRKKAFATLEIEKAVDLARLLVHLQERGLLDLGL